MVRIPYIEGLRDIPNFLYSTTDVAIWSISEVGIGLGASAAATLRPLLRKVFGDTSISGGSASRKMSYNWGGNNPSRSGYLEQASGHDLDPERGMGNAIPLEPGKNVAHVRTLSRSQSTRGLRDWDSTKEKDSQSDEEFPSSLAQLGGIRKTVNITQH